MDGTKIDQWIINNMNTIGINNKELINHEIINGKILICQNKLYLLNIINIYYGTYELDNYISNNNIYTSIINVYQ